MPANSVTSTATDLDALGGVELSEDDPFADALVPLARAVFDWQNLRGDTQPSQSEMIRRGDIMAVALSGVSHMLTELAHNRDELVDALTERAAMLNRALELGERAIASYNAKVEDFAAETLRSSHLAAQITELSIYLATFAWPVPCEGSATDVAAKIITAYRVDVAELRDRVCDLAAELDATGMVDPDEGALSIAQDVRWDHDRSHAQWAWAICPAAPCIAAREYVS